MMLEEVKLAFKPKYKVSELPTITASREAYEFIMPVAQETLLHFESFYIILLNRANKVVGWKKISDGGIHGTFADIRIILQTAILCNCSALILCHNHPSGKKTPSDADISLTKNIKEAAKLVEISVLDHIILTQDEFYSFADNGMI